MFEHVSAEQVKQALRENARQAREAAQRVREARRESEQRHEEGCAAPCCEPPSRGEGVDAKIPGGGDR